VAGGTIYFFLEIGRLPIRLVLILVVGALVTVYKMVQSLFLRVESADPGRTLDEPEAPKLWAMAREIAETVGTRPIDEIRVTPGTELAVYERGSARDRAHDHAHRVLVLGVGVLNDFRLSAFRAVLAHEYGHFSHRDTAGGDVALRVRQDIVKFASAMAQHGQAVAWNAAFQFLRCYAFLFRRISHGASRLQEVLADRVAAQNYGAVCFEEGLRHVIRRAIEFEAAAQREITSAVETQRDCRNLYELPATIEDHVDDRLNDILSRATTEDDTHPAPLDRFRLVRELTSHADAAAPGLVWELFVHRERLTAEMTAVIQSHVRLAPTPLTSPASAGIESGV
jgi:Zn-dependent protease with chaperone function